MRLVKTPAVVLPAVSTAVTNRKPNLEKTMKTLKPIFATTILALALSVPASAGELLTPGATPPPPPPPPPLNIIVNVSEPAVPTSVLGDVSTPCLVDILWVLASIF